MKGKRLPILKLAQHEELLRTKCQPVLSIDDEILQLVADMEETLEKRGVGLAAPQVGHTLRIFVLQRKDVPHVYINPEIIESEGEQISWEACLSVPGVAANLTRAKRVKVRATNIEGETFEQEFEDFGACVVQHEYDHLQGVLITDAAVV